MNPKELYAEIMADKERYDFCGRGEKMADARDNDTYRIVILNKAKKRGLCNESCGFIFTDSEEIANFGI